MLNLCSWPDFTDTVRVQLNYNELTKEQEKYLRCEVILQVHMMWDALLSVLYTIIRVWLYFNES